MNSGHNRITVEALCSGRDKSELRATLPKNALVGEVKVTEANDV